MKKTQVKKALAAKSPEELQAELTTEKLKQTRRNIARARTLIHQKAGQA
jgi:ribosomal protein L29